MKVDRAIKRTLSSVSPSPLVSLLALAALLFAVFAIHSEATGHAMHTPVAASSAIAGETGGVVGMADVVAAPVAWVMSSGTLNGLLDCALLAMTCVLLLTLVAMVFLTRLPALYRRLLDAGGVALSSWRTAALAIHQPSLTFLSISRV